MTTMNQEAFVALSQHIRPFVGANNLKAWKALLTTLTFEVMAVILINSNACEFGWILHTLTSIRLFIQMHDMAHGCFFKQNQLNKMIGKMIGIYTWIPMRHWFDVHNRHHQHYGNIDKKDESHTIIYTKLDYDSLPKGKKIMIRLIRQPIIFFLLTYQYIWFVGSIFENIKKYTLWSHVNLEKLASILLYFFVFPILGISAKRMLLSLAISVVAGTILFHLQHSVNAPYLQRQDNWDYKQASLEGSTFLKIPFFLKPFINGVEYHHLHHLNTKIPSYNLQICHETFEDRPDQENCWSSLRINQVGYKLALMSMMNALYDEETGNYIPFSYEHI